MRNSSSPILHLVHPRPVEWTTIILPISEELGVPLVSYSQWLTELEKGGEGSIAEADAMRANPALGLLDLFRARQDGGLPASISRPSTVRAEETSKELANMPELGLEDAKRWVAAWRASGFLPSRPMIC